MKSWKLITLCGFLSAFIFLAHGFRKPQLYKAKLNFMLNEDDGGGLGGISNLLGQFGLGGSSSESNLDKILELSRARTITQSALFTKATINNKLDFLANHLILSLELEKRWSEKALLPFLGGEDDNLDLTDFRFSHDSLPIFSLKENKALKKIHQHLMGKDLQGGAFQSNYSELSGIMNFSMMTTDAELSIDVVNMLFEKLSDYYIGRSTEKQQKNYTLIKSKYDSIQSSLNNVMYSIARFEDQNRGLIKKQDSYKLKKLKGEEIKLGSMLGEAEKQFQLAQISLESNDAYIQLIDEPLLPLRPVNKGRLYFFLLGGLLGGLFSLVFLITKKAYRDLMAV